MGAATVSSTVLRMTCSVRLLPKKRHKTICRLKRLKKKPFTIRTNQYSSRFFINTKVYHIKDVSNCVNHKEKLNLGNQCNDSTPRQTIDKMIPINYSGDVNNNLPKWSVATKVPVITKNNLPSSLKRSETPSSYSAINRKTVFKSSTDSHLTKRHIYSNDLTKPCGSSFKSQGYESTRNDSVKSFHDLRMLSHDKFRIRFPVPPPVLWMALLSLLSVAAESCRYSSVDSRHTMCVFMPKQCPGKMMIRTGELTCHDKERILTKHNMLRQEAALGQVRGQPAALNMRTMVWDDELAMVAQRWADQCMPGHDRSRNVGRFAAGQNVAAVWTYERDEGDTPDFVTQVEAWFMEVDQHGFSKGSVDPFRFSKPTGHYTQLVWADTYLVGCGYTYYLDSEGNGYTKLYVCNYGPGGNVVGGSMYKVGFPGQPYCVGNGLRPSTDYQGLCEEDGVNYKSMCAMGGSSMFHKPKASSLMMMMDGNHVEEFEHSHARPSSSAHPMEVMHPDPPHMEMHHMMHSMRAGPSHALHHQQGHMMLPPPPPPHDFGPPLRPRHGGGGGNGLMKNIRTPFAGLVNALNPWDLLDRFKLT